MADVKYTLESMPDIVLEVPEDYVNNFRGLIEYLSKEGFRGLRKGISKYPYLQIPSIFPCALKLTINRGIETDLMKVLRDELFLKVCISLNEKNLGNFENQEAYALDSRLVLALKRLIED